MFPKLRFPNFKDEWKENKIEDVIEIGSGKDYKHLSFGNIPVYGTGGYMLSVDKALSDNKDAIGIGRKGTIDNPFILKAPFWTVDTLFYCVPKENYDLNYLFDIFQTIKWKDFDESTGVPSLSKTQINNVHIFVPALEEQQKIGSFFTEIDNFISLNEEKLTELQDLKKSFLQKMFPKPGEVIPEIRFPGFEAEWEEKHFSDFLAEYIEKTTRNNEHQILSSTKESVVSQEEHFKKQVASANNIGYKILKIDQLVLSPQNIWMGNININTKYEIGIVSPSYKIYDIHDLDKDYLNSIIKTPTMLNKYNAASKEGASMVRKNLDVDDFMNISFLVPSLQEQQKIGSFFKEFDNRIELQKQKLDEIKKYKKGLLQQMFC